MEDRGERHAHLVSDLLQVMAGGAQLEHAPILGLEVGQTWAMYQR